MMSENKKYNYASSLGRVQFLANLEIIKERLDKGHTFQSIYSDLVREKKVTCSYKNFARYKVAFLGKSNRNIIKLKENTQEKSANVHQLKHVPSRSEQPSKINHRPDLDEKDKFMPHGYDPVGEKPTENKKEEENKGDNK